MQLTEGKLWLSPSDLSAHLACPHLTTEQLAVARGERERPHGRDAITDLVAEKGGTHEAAFLAKLRADGRDVVEIGLGDGFDAAARATEEAMRAGREVIYQATFVTDGWRGLSDFVIRVDEPSELGPWSYEAWDTKLARSAKPAAVLQVVFYSDAIRRVQGCLPGLMHVVPGTGVVESFRPGDFDAFFRIAQSRVRAHVEEQPVTYPWRCEHCSRCEFIPVCASRWGEDDHLLLVAGARRDQIRKLNGAGVSTLEELAARLRRWWCRVWQRRWSTGCAIRPGCSFTVARQAS